MRKLSGLFFALFIVFSLAPAVWAGGPELQPPDDLPFVPGEVLVKFQPQVGALGVFSLQADGLEPLETIPHASVIRVRVGTGRERQTIADLLARGDVEYAGLNYRVQATDTPNDTYFANQWALQTGFLDAPSAWTTHHGTGTVTVAVIDSGVDLDHPDLQANITSGWDFVDDDSLPDDEFGHGTHVAGIIAAVGNNGIGVSGVSWGARIMPVRALDSYGSGTISDVASAIYYAVDNGARVINMSLGAPGTSYPCTGFEVVRDAMQYALNHDVLVVVSAGNESASAVSCPAAYDQAVAVAATNSSDTLAYYSNFGPRLDIAAPGSSIFSTLRGGSYGYMSGTSMAAPHVAGLAALIWSYTPSLSRSQVQELIQTSADDLGSPGWDEQYGYGRINAANVFRLMAPQATGVYLPDSGGLGGSTTDTYTTVTITTHNPKTITWSASLVPAVSWVEIVPPTSGQVSSGSPTTLTLHGIVQPSYSPETTALVLTGVTGDGEPLPDVVIPVYVWKQQIFLPLVFR